MLCRVVLVLFGLLPMCSAAFAEDAFFRIRLIDLKFTEGELPDYTVSVENTRVWQRLRDMRLEVQLDESGEAYFQYHQSWGSVFDLVRADDRAALFLVIRAPEKRAVTGRLFLPKPDVSGLVGVKFRIPADATTKESARQFQLGKIEHYERLLRNRGPGAAWFRHQSEMAAKWLDHRLLAQNRSWSNLPILNEWKRRYPDRDPHRRFWGVELVCPSGARYVWNEQWRTMESPVFGHPGEPKLPDSPVLIFPFAKASFGLTFELDGLRSRLELSREKQ